MSTTQSIFLDGKVVFKKTEKVIIYIITDNYLYFIDQNNPSEINYKFLINKVYWELCENKDIQLIYYLDENKHPVDFHFDFKIHFFTQDEIEIFQYAIQAHKDIVKQSINKIIINTINDLNKQYIYGKKPLVDLFPFKATDSLHDVLAYLLNQYQCQNTEKYQAEDGFPIKFSEKLSRTFEDKKENEKHSSFYALAGSFLSTYLDKYTLNGDDKHNDIVKELSTLFKKWINIAYVPSDFRYFYNRIQNLFSKSLEKFPHLYLKPNIIDVKSKLTDACQCLENARSAVNEPEKKIFPLKTFARLNYGNEGCLDNKDVKYLSTYIYYILKNFIYVENLNEIKEIFDKFTDIMMKYFEAQDNQNDLDVCYIRFKLLFFNMVDNDKIGFIQKAEQKYLDALNKISKNATK